MSIFLPYTQQNLNKSGDYGIPEPVFDLLVKHNIISKIPTDADMKIISVVNLFWDSAFGRDFIKMKLFSVRKSRRQELVDNCVMSPIEQYIYNTYKEARIGGYKVNRATIQQRVAMHFKVTVSLEDIEVIRKRVSVNKKLVSRVE